MQKTELRIMATGSGSWLLNQVVLRRVRERGEQSQKQVPLFLFWQHLLDGLVLLLWLLVPLWR